MKPLTRFSSIEASIPSEDITAVNESPLAEESENEESLSLQINKVAEDVATSDADSAESQDSTDSEADGTAALEEAGSVSDALSEENKPSFSNPVLVKRFERARELMLIGLNDWAKWDLYDIERKTSNKEYLKNLMQEYQTVENFNRSAYIAQVNFGAQRAAHGIEGVRYLWEFAFPKAYNQFVSKYSQQINVEPELIWGIMRAESTYKRDVISPVGALGLMQVMPSTGFKVAQSIKDKDFTPKKLLEADTAIKIGAHYLKRLEKKFDGYIPLVAAAYNAGPHRVMSWLAQFGNLEVDEFVEHIPFLETRNYVKKVSSYFHTYSVLYSNKRDSLSYLSETLKMELPDKVVAKEAWED
jgi:soluble lytic murein transglycosylase